MTCDIAINAYWTGLGAGTVVVAWLAHVCWTDYRTKRTRQSASPASAEALQAFAERVLCPSDLGFAVTAEVRDAARLALGLPAVETLAARRHRRA